MPVEIDQPASPNQVGAPKVSPKKVVDEFPSDVLAMQPETPTKPIFDYIPEPLKKNLHELSSKAGTAIQKAQNWTQEKVPVVTEFYVKTIEPTVRPVVEFAKEKHTQYPAAPVLALALFSLIYGGCFPKIVLLYAAYQVSGASRFLESVSAFYTQSMKNVPSEATAFKDKAAIFFRSTDTQQFVKIVNSFGTQFCIFVAIMNNALARNITLGILLGNDFGAIMSGKIKEQVKTFLKTEGSRKWAPALTGAIMSTACTIVAYVSPSFACAMIAAVPAAGAIIDNLLPYMPSELSESQKRTMSFLVALVAVIYQKLTSFAISGGIVGTTIKFFVSLANMNAVTSVPH